MSGQSKSRNWLPFNINHAVRVKLTQRGLDVLKAKHDALYEWSQSVKGPLRPWEPPTLKDGWYETQLWCLMNDFGDETRMGLDPCFETTIELTAPVSERGTSEPFVHAFSIKRGKEDGWWYLHGEQLVPGLNLAHTDLQTVLDDLLPAWRKLHEVAPQQVPAPPMGLSEIKT